MQILINFRQPNKWTCGPACAKVALSYYGIDKTLKELINDLQTSEEHGTDQRNLIKVFRDNGLGVRERINASLQDIQASLKQGLVIVGFWIPYYKESHYAIVKQIKSDRIFLHNTWFGPSHSYSLKYFLRNWWDEEGKRWMLFLNLSG